MFVLCRYFEQLVDQFEARMVSYRQQIETLENHLSVLYQPVRHSPAEIFTLIKRLHETFIALAAQLQQVHENIKVSGACRVFLSLLSSVPTVLVDTRLDCCCQVHTRNEKYDSF